MAKISQARKALKQTKDYRGAHSTATGDFAKYPGESDRPAADSGVDLASIDAAFAPPAKDEPAEAPKPARATRKRTTEQ
jgi:hypothetical protein